MDLSEESSTFSGNGGSTTIEASATSIHSGGNYSAGRDLTFINTIVKDAETAVPSQESKWLASLASVNHYAVQKEIYEKISPGTCKWILEDAQFNSWMLGHSRIFWGVGIPGAGKTVLTSFVIDYLEERARSRPDADVVAFVYCRYTDSLSASNILAALLQQLLDGSQAVMELVSGGLYASYTKKDTRPTLSELERTLRAAIALLPQAFIMLDALDELEEACREDIIRIITSLDQNARIFITSRELDFDSIRPNMRIRAPKEDFTLFISQEIHKLPKLRSLLGNRPEVTANVIEQIQSRSDGMFLLSTLQLAALRSVTSIKSLKRSIEVLPTTLHDMYEMTLGRIKNQSGEESSLALRAILLVTHATRPLKSKELLAALATELDSVELDDDAMTDHRTLVSVCCGLLECNSGPNNLSQLIHYTTHDFFKVRPENPLSHPHSFLANICASYLWAVDNRLNPPLVEMLHDSFRLSGIFPFLMYAIENLGYHTNQSTPENLDSIPGHVYSYFIHHRSSLIYPPTADTCDIYHFAAVYGFLPSLLKCSDDHSDLDPNALSQAGYTVLMFAVRGCHLPSLDICLGTGKARINFPISHNSWGLGLSALVMAVDMGHLPTVQRLIEAGASANIVELLNYAIWLGRVELVAPLVQLLSSQVNDFSDDRYGAYQRTALSSGCFQGQLAMVMPLLGCNNIDVNLHQPGDITPLLLAVIGSWASVVQTLVDDPRVDLLARDEYGRTALHLSAAFLDYEAHDHTLKFLLKKPAMRSIINDKDKGGETALHSACLNPRARGRSAAAELLLACEGVDITLRDKQGMLALHHACYSKNYVFLRDLKAHELAKHRSNQVKTVQLLLQHPGAQEPSHLNAVVEDVDEGEDMGLARDAGLTGLTALDIAIRAEATEIVALLEEAGAQRSGLLTSGSL